MKSEIVEIDTSAIYRIGSLELDGNELIHQVANGLRYEKLSEQLIEEGVIQ